MFQKKYELKELTNQTFELFGVDAPANLGSALLKNISNTDKTNETTIPTYLYKDDRVRSLAEEHSEINWYPVEIYARAPWESGVPDFDKI